MHTAEDSFGSLRSPFRPDGNAHARFLPVTDAYHYRQALLRKHAQRGARLS